jgi:hypothetical protein
MMKTILAEVLPAVPWSTTGQWMLGFIGILSVVYLALGVLNQSKKAFGRRPPIEEELESRAKSFRGEIAHARNSVLKEIRPPIESLEKRTTRIEEDIEYIKQDRERKWITLTNEMHQLDVKLATMIGRIESLLKKVDNR